MNKKLQVFVSSTYTDLIEERQAAVEAILDAGHIPAGMELFKAGNESQLKTIYKWIDESDVYMLILGGRYGSIEEKSGKSYTQLEYEYAFSKNIPVFAVVLSETFLTNKINSLGLKNVTEQIAPNQYKDFKSLVMSKIIREVDDCKDIKITIHSTLNEFMQDYDLVGWVRGDINTAETSYKSNYKTEINNKLILYLKELSSTLDILLTNLYIPKNENSFANDWNLFATKYRELYIFCHINKNNMSYYSDDLQHTFSIWDNLVSIISNIKNNQNDIPTANDNKSLEMLFSNLYNILSKLICECESLNIANK